MIQDWETDKVFLSNLLQPGLYNRIERIFQNEGICCEYLPFTRDIPVRDFMPIQLSDNIFIQYHFYPDYLRGKRKFRTPKSSIDRICEWLKIKTKCSDIIIDGGNVTPCGKYIIMTDKVFTENGREKGDVAFTGMLEKLLESEIIFIPWHKMCTDILMAL
jgi:agmatine deiminase